MIKLKPYKVGENDIVAAETPEQALSILLTGFGDGHYDFLTLDDVEGLTDKMESMVFSEDGEPIQTLGFYVIQCKGVPQYLYGWE